MWIKHKTLDIEKEEYYFSNTPGKKAVSLQRIAHEIWGPELFLQRNMNANQIIVFIVNGEGTLRLDGKTHKLNPGMTFSTGKGNSWQLSTDGNKMEIFILACSPRSGELFRKYLGAKGFAESLRSPLDIQKMFELIFQEAKHGSFYSHEICLHHLHAMLMKIAQNKVSKTKRGKQSLLTFNKCRQYIDRHFEKTRLPREVSEACNLAHEYMCRLFKQYEKKSPQQYLISLKLNRAVYLLTTTQLSIKQISEELSFDSPYTFSRTFKKHTGISPTDCRSSD